MEDKRLLIFVKACEHLSFTKASEDLCLSQPAVTKQIAALEDHFSLKFFERIGNKLVLTSDGKDLLHHARIILNEYQKLNQELSLKKGKIKGELKIGSSTTIAQYILPKILAEFMNDYPHIKITLHTANSELIEKALIDGEIHLGLVENNSHKSNLVYESFADDRLILVAGTQGKFKNNFSIEEFLKLPLILRERGSGTLDVIISTLKNFEITLDMLNIKMFIGATEGIKLFLQNSDSVGIVSIYALQNELKNGSLKELKIDKLNFTRKLNIVRTQGEHLPTVEIFKSYLCNNFKL